MAVTQEILELRFNNWSDHTSRHTVFVANAVLSDQSVADYKSVQLDGSSYLQIIDNNQDWLLGATPSTSRVNRDWLPSNSDNEFTIDTWVYPTPSGTQRYYPICSSFKSIWWNRINYKLGWSFQIDALTGKLQLVSYTFGYSKVIETFTTVPINQWSHIVLMSWRQVDHSAKLFYINGQPDGGYLTSQTPVRTNTTGSLFTDSFPISNIMTYEAQYGVSGNPEYCPFYIGLGPRSSLTDPDIVDSFFFQSRYGIGFHGYIGRFRVCLGTRYNTQSQVFNPLIDPSTTTTSSTATSTTTTTTQTTTTQGEWGEIPLEVNSKDLLVLKLRNNINDLTNRHYIRSYGDLTFSLSSLGCKSLHFDGTNYLEATLNNYDFSLCSTLLVNEYVETSPLCLTNNSFSLEFWVYPMSTDQRYLGICGSFSIDFFPTDADDYSNYGYLLARTDFKLGWSIQLDTQTHRLQFINYSFGSVSIIFESNLTIPSDEWTHVAIMSIPNDQYSTKYLFINGTPDPINPYKNPSLGWTNGVHRSSVNSPVNSYACLFIGLGAFTYIGETETVASLDYTQGSKFIGNISTFRLSSDHLYPTDGSEFVPYRIPNTTTISTTQTTTTTQSTVTSTTLPPEGYVRVGGSLFASSSQPSDPVIYTEDDKIETAWEPVSSPESWLGIECDDSTD